MVLGKKVTIFLIGNGAEIRPLEMARKGPGKSLFKHTIHLSCGARGIEWA